MAAKNAPLAVNLAQCSVLNATKPANLDSVLGPGGELVSDADEQLLIGVALAQASKVHSLIITAPVALAPSEVALFVNAPSLGFEDAEDRPATQRIALNAAHAAGEPIPLKFVSFQNVSHLTLFLPNNLGSSEETAVQKVEIIGQPLSTTNMSELKKCGG